MYTKWPALAEVCVHRLLLLLCFYLRQRIRLCSVTVCLFVCLFICMCVCSRSRLLKKLWTKEWIESWRSINDVATCRYLRAKTQFDGFPNVRYRHFRFFAPKNPTMCQNIVNLCSEIALLRSSPPSPQVLHIRPPHTVATWGWGMHTFISIQRTRCFAFFATFFPELQRSVNTVR